MAEWKFLTNNALVLCAVAKQSRITVREIATSIGITERTTRNIIADLEANGYIAKKREGRRIRYRINPDLPLRQDLQQGKAVGDLLEVLGWKRKQRKPAQLDESVR